MWRCLGVDLHWKKVAEPYQCAMTTALINPNFTIDDKVLANKQFIMKTRVRAHLVYKYTTNLVHSNTTAVYSTSHLRSNSII